MIPTPWGDLRVADAHVHFFSRRFLELLAARRTGLTPERACEIAGIEPPPGEPEALAGKWAAELDRNGVDRAALIASLPGDESSVSRAVAAHPSRFRGFYVSNPLAPDAVERLEPVAARKALHAICVFPAMHRYSIADDRAGPLLDFAERSNAPVFVHCGVLSVGIRGKLGLPSPFDMRFSNPIDLHGVALSHPNVRFIIPHFGAGFFREALMVADLCPNVWLDTSSSNSWMRYQAAPITLTDVFRRALEVAGPSRLVFGTDSSHFPRGWNRAIFEQQVAALHQAGADAAAAELILSRNFDSLLG